MERARVEVPTAAKGRMSHCDSCALKPGRWEFDLSGQERDSLERAPLARHLIPADRLIARLIARTARARNTPCGRESARMFISRIIIRYQSFSGARYRERPI